MDRRVRAEGANTSGGDPSTAVAADGEHLVPGSEGPRRSGEGWQGWGGRGAGEAAEVLFVLPAFAIDASTPMPADQAAARAAYKKGTLRGRSAPRCSASHAVCIPPPSVRLAPCPGLLASQYLLRDCGRARYVAVESSGCRSSSL